MTKTFVMNGYIDKMSASDQDFRYMALNDVMNDVKQDPANFTGDETVENRVLNSILKLLEDKISEVKNQAVKCLGVLSKVVRENQMELIMDKLIELFGKKDEETRDIAGLALKTITAELPQDSKIAQKTCITLTPKLLNQLRVLSTPAPSMIDILAILSTLVTRFPANMSDPTLSPQPLTVLTPLLDHSRPAVRKRAIITLAQFLPPSPPEAFSHLLHTILIPNLSHSNIEVQKTNISLIAAVARFTPQKIAPALSNLVPHILKAVSSSDPDLCEGALQTLETFVYRCPAEMSPFLGFVIGASVQNIKYDPNYTSVDDGEDEEMEDVDNESDGGLGEYSDDEDTSYKVRRSATKLLAAIIGTRSDMLLALYKEVSPVLISRFGDRETLVKTEIWSTYVLLLNQTALSSEDARVREVDSPTSGVKRKRESMDGMVLDGSPLAILNSQVPQLAKQLLGQLKGSRVPPNVLQEGFRVFTALLNVLPGVLASHSGPIITTTGAVLSQPVSTGTASLHLSALSFLGLFLSNHAPSTFVPFLPKVTPILLNILRQRHPRLTSESFRTFSSLLKALRPVKQSDWADQVYNEALMRLLANDTDAQVRQSAESCIGDLWVCAPETVQNKGGKEWDAITRSTDRIDNPIKVITYVADEGTVSDRWVDGCVNWLMSVLKRGGRQGKVEAFSCLENLIRRYQNGLPPQLPESLTNMLTSYMSTSDISLLAHSFTILSILLEINPSVTYPLVESRLLKGIYALSLTPLLAGASLDSLLSFYNALVLADQDIGNKIIPKLLLEVQEGAKNTTSPGNVAKCIAKVVEANKTIAAGVITQFTKLMQSGKINELSLVLSLMTLGELGRFISMGDQSHVFNATIEFFRSDSDDVKSAAAFAVGSMAIGDMDAFLPTVLKMVERNNAQKLLALHALKEVVSNSAHSQLEKVSDGLWDPLFENSAGSEEASRNVAASCLGKLTTLKSAVYLPRLQSRLRDPNPSIRATVISALRYTFIDSDRSYDELLGPVIVDFLSLIQDQDLVVQQLALSALNSAAKNKPHLIIDHLNALIFLLYSQTVVNSQLIEVVEMGPWKHRVDKGVDARKAAYETMYTLLDTCISKIELQAFLERVLKGLSDDSDEIKVICHMMLFRIAQTAPTAVVQRLDEAADPLAKTMADVAVEKNTVKQDLERASELQRSALRAIVALSKIQQPGAAPHFENMVEKVRVGQYANEFKELMQ